MTSEQKNAAYSQLLLQLRGGEPACALNIPHLEQRTILQAYLNAQGTISHPERLDLEVALLVSEKQAEEAEKLWQGAQSTQHGGLRRIAWLGLTALDLLGAAFDASAAEVFAGSPHEETYRHWCSKVSQFERRRTEDAEIRVKRLFPEAVVPSKQRISDSGYDVTLLYEKKRTGNVILFGTGLVVEPPFGWYFDVVPRSSITKLGYILANSVGVIDRAYRGELFVPLIKENLSAPDLDLPQRVVQLIPRPIIHFPVVEVEELSDTLRGDRGFGSSGK